MWTDTVDVPGKTFQLELDGNDFVPWKFEAQSCGTGAPALIL